MRREDPIEKVRALLQRLQDLLNQLADALNRILKWIPPGLGWVAERIQEGWSWLQSKLCELWAWIAKIFTNPGNPVRLSEVGNEWNTLVGGPVSSQSGVIEAGQLLVDDRWQGEAATAYRQSGPGQENALDQVKSGFADGAFHALDKMQSAIWVFGLRWPAA